MPENISEEMPETYMHIFREIFREDPVLLSGHMDTLSRPKARKIIGEDGVIRSAGKAVLGADDVAGLVEILEGIRSVKEAGVPHRDIEILFAIAEELYIKAAAYLIFQRFVQKKPMYWTSADRLEARHIKHRL